MLSLCNFEIDSFEFVSCFKMEMKVPQLDCGQIQYTVFIHAALYIFCTQEAIKEYVRTDTYLFEKLKCSLKSKFIQTSKRKME